MCIHLLFEQQVESTPEAIAVVFEEHSLTYRELNRRANQLAHYLRTLGVQPEILVGIGVERSLEMIIGLLGILKAGGAYVPLDPSYPQERLAFMLKDAQISVLLTQQHLLPTLLASPFCSSIVCIDTDWPMISQYSELNPNNLTQLNNLAYVIYTSGSTGLPKGVLIEHRGLPNLALTQIRRFGISPDSRVLQFSSLNFDASGWEIIMALAGATLFLAKRDTLLPGLPLWQFLHKYAITIVTLPPSVLNLLPVAPLPSLQTVIVAGESCSAELVARWQPGRRFFNAYGPTETTVCATIFECTTDKVNQPSPTPIGRPIANTQVYVLDSHLQRVPIGVPGELLVGGIGLARGYLNRPELTAEKFIPNPFSNNSTARLYKTGDLVRYRPDGHLEFLGRIDHQVKIRGFRIELGEIEAVLNQYPMVREAVVITRQDNPGDKRLVAYIVSHPNTPCFQNPQFLRTTELRKFLKEKLPDYMLPAAFVFLDTLPLTPNGKVDRQALPPPEELGRELDTLYLAPQTEMEQTIATIWQRVLGLQKVGIQDNFFDLGGNSLLVVQMQPQLVESLNREIPVMALFQYPTIKALVHYLEQPSSEDIETPAWQANYERVQKQKAVRHKHRT